MTPVDGITPPKNNRTKKPVKKPAKKKVVNKKQTPKKEKVVSSSKEKNTEHKDSLPGKVIENSKTHFVWSVSIIIVIIIFIIWVSLVLSGRLYSNDNKSSDENFLDNFTTELDQAWDKFRENFLKIKNATEEATTEEERIKELEKSVFPDFDQYK